MITNTRERIIEYIQNHGQARAKDISAELGINRAATHRQLNKLLISNKILRVGKPPLVFYKLGEQNLPQKPYSLNVSPEALKIIQNNFLTITPDGRLLYGVEGFINWATVYQKNKPLEPIAIEYVNTYNLNRRIFEKEGWIDATAKLTDNFHDTAINKMLVQDVYSYKIFGRTKLAKMVMYAKQLGDKSLIDQISDIAKPIIEKIIKEYKIESVVFIPPTIPRPLQFMSELKFRLNLHIPELELAKVVPGDIPIPQITLSTLTERVINARSSIFLKNNSQYHYKRVLLIDDVVGSGASFHETAEKLRNNNIGDNLIIAFGLVGNIKGYEVIREI